MLAARNDRPRRGLGALAVLTLLCAGCVSACGSSHSTSTTATTAYLNVFRVERDIERSILRQRHLKSTVLCPGRVPRKPGEFPCVATTVDPKTHKPVQTPFVVTIHNSSGAFSYLGERVGT